MGKPDLDVDGTIILKWIFKKWGWEGMGRLIWVRITRQVAGCCEDGYEPFWRSLGTVRCDTSTASRHRSVRCECEMTHRATYEWPTVSAKPDGSSNHCFADQNCPPSLSGPRCTRKTTFPKSNRSSCHPLPTELGQTKNRISGGARLCIVQWPAGIIIILQEPFI